MSLGRQPGMCCSHSSPKRAVVRWNDQECPNAPPCEQHNLEASIQAADVHPSSGCPLQRAEQDFSKRKVDFLSFAVVLRCSPDVPVWISMVLRPPPQQWARLITARESLMVDQFDSFPPNIKCYWISCCLKLILLAQRNNLSCLLVKLQIPNNCFWGSGESQTQYDWVCSEEGIDKNTCPLLVWTEVVLYWWKKKMDPL